MSRHEANYTEVKVTVAIVANLYPYLEAEAKRRKLTIDALVSQILNEDLAGKRVNSRRKDAKPPGSCASPVKPQASRL